MKKIVILLGICGVILACNSSNTTSSTEDTTSTSQDTVTTLPADTAATTTQAPPADVPATTPPAATPTPSTPKATPPAPKTAEQKPASTEKGEQLISKSDCLACHRLNEKLVGPAYTAVATKYDDTEANLNYLAGKIISGGAGVWGEIPMTPHPAVSAADAKEMARYILSLK